MQLNNEHGQFTVNAHMGGVAGRSGNVNSDRALTTGNKEITTVTSIGRDNPTTAEAQRSATILRILQGSEKLLDESPFVQNIWFPQTDDGVLIWPKEWSSPQLQPPKPRPSTQTGNMVHHTLNSSQQDGVNYMLSELDSHRITLIQGPPGTGKTSVIASFVQYSVQLGRGGIWLVAQSNVAVKNIAEKLISRGFMDWKLLVSKDFHFEWWANLKSSFLFLILNCFRHEHLYGKVQNNIIRSDEFNFASNKANLQGVQVMLCTLSMLSNNSIFRFIKEIPLRVLVVDEASQIEIGNYIAPFSSFKRTLRKTCFIGDDKQCEYLSLLILLYSQFIFYFSTTSWTRGLARSSKYF
jgi:regulator of nonsense transcripts 1